MHFGKSAATIGEVKAKLSCPIQWFEQGGVAHWCYAPINSKVQHPPPGNPPGI